MGLAAAALGLYLVSISSVVILLTGVFCFAVGVTYSYGIIPISHTPFGEIVSGSVMGFCIPFIAVEISHPMITIAVQDFSRLVITADWVELLSLAALVMPLIFCVAPIMLANNICDINDDIRVKRYTLPVCIGLKKSLRLYVLFYIVGYLFIIAVSLLRFVPLFTLVVLLTCIPVRKNILRFIALQDRKRTFFTAILNFLLIALPYAACIWLGALLT